jgi:pyruvate carboxylase
MKINFLKVKRSIENLNKRGLKKATSQLCLQSTLRSPDTTSPPPETKFISNVPIKNNDFMVKETQEDYNKLLNYFGSIPCNNRISNIKDEYLDMKDYMSFEIQNQHQIMEAIKSGEIPFYTSDNEDSTEVLVINEDE